MLFKGYIQNLAQCLQYSRHSNICWMNEISAYFLSINLIRCPFVLQNGNGLTEILGKFADSPDMPAGLHNSKMRPQMKSNEQNQRDSCFSDTLSKWLNAKEFCFKRWEKEEKQTNQRTENFRKSPTCTIRDHNNVLNHYTCSSVQFL